MFNQLDQIVRQVSAEVSDGSGVRYIKDSFFDANNNLTRTDVRNIDASGAVQANASFTTSYEYEKLNTWCAASRRSAPPARP